MTDDVLVPVETLRSYVTGIFTAHGMPDDQAAIVVDNLIEADLRGVESHGMNLVDLYVARLQSGAMSASTEVSVTRDDGSTMLLDGGMGLGQVAGQVAIEHCIERAREHGLAAIGVNNTSHLGMLAYFTKQAADAGIFAMAFQNGPTIVSPYGSTTPMFSTNPFSYAAPAGEEAPVLLDMATTAVAGNKVLLYQKRGDAEMPEGWCNDADGRPTTDPQEAVMSGLQWFGGYKGFGMAMLVELLSGLLTGSAFGRTEVDTELPTGAARVTKGYLFWGLDVSRFMPVDDFRARVDTLIRDVHSAEPAVDVERVYVPGEIEQLRRADRAETGIPLSAALIAELEKRGAEVGLGTIG